MPELPHLLFKMRKDQGLTQRALAKKAEGEVSDGYISLIEQGKYVPSRKVVRALAKALGDKDGLLMAAADRDRLPRGAEVTVERAKEEIKKMRDQLKVSNEIGWLAQMLPAHISRVLSVGHTTDNRMVARFYVDLFWELFQEGLVDEAFCTRYAETVEKLQDHYHREWPRDLRRSPFEMAQELTYEKNPPQLEKALAIVQHVNKVYLPMLEKATGEKVPPIEMSRQEADEAMEQDKNLDGRSEPFNPLGDR